MSETLLEVKLARPKGNVIDSAMIESLRAAVRGAEGPVRAILITAEGPHFSFGASVEEHRPGEVERFLPAFHALFRDLVACGRPLLAAVRGQCLGGGLEIAAFCHRVFAAPDARLGSPEIKLGVFAPVASIVLPHRIGRAAADDLLLTGRSVGAAEARSIGLVDEIADDPEKAARAWHEKHLVPHSASSLALAVRAARFALEQEIEATLPRLEALYLERLMATTDAKEGIESFLAKRGPAWTHR